MKPVAFLPLLLLGASCLAAQNGYIGAALLSSAGMPGTVVLTVEDGSPAAIAGLKPFDLVVALNGEHLEAPGELVKRVAAAAPGSVLALDVQRADKPLRLEITAAPPPAVISTETTALFQAVELHGKRGFPGWLVVTAERIGFWTGADPGGIFLHDASDLERVDLLGNNAIHLKIRGDSGRELALATAVGAKRAVYPSPAAMIMALADFPGYPTNPPPSAAVQLTVGEADAELRLALEHLFAGVQGNDETFPPSSIQVTMSGFEVDQGNRLTQGKFAGQPASDRPAKIAASFSGPQVYVGLATNSFGRYGGDAFIPNKRFLATFDQVFTSGVQWLIFNRQSDAQAFVDSFNRLVYAAYHPEQQKAELDAFNQAAAAWRSQPKRPALSDAANRERVLAENAIGEKNPDEALAHYEAALAAEAMWPEGWYNAAILAGEMKDYALAVDHMKRYLTLAPDAPDARAARDKVIVWQDKLSQSGT
jgi:tetratricopeptide (TPR) repeat protein